MPSVSIELAANIAKLQSDMNRAVAVVDRGFSDMKRAGDMLKNIFGALGIGLSAYEILGYGKALVEVGSRLKELNGITGISVERLSAYRFAAQSTHVDLDQLVTGFTRLSVAIGESLESPVSKSARAFRELGISQQYLRTNANDLGAVFEMVAQKLSEYEDGAWKIEKVRQLFGRSGAEFINMLNDLSARIEEARQNNLIFTDSFASAANSLQKEMLKIRGSMDAAVAGSSLMKEGIEDLVIAMRHLSAIAVAGVGELESFGISIMTLAKIMRNFAEVSTKKSDLSVWLFALDAMVNRNVEIFEDGAKRIAQIHNDVAKAIDDITRPGKAPLPPWNLDMFLDGPKKITTFMNESFWPAVTGKKKPPATVTPASPAFLSMMRELQRISADAQASMTQTEKEQAMGRVAAWRQEQLDKIRDLRETLSPAEAARLGKAVNDAYISQVQKIQTEHPFSTAYASMTEEIRQQEEAANLAMIDDEREAALKRVQIWHDEKVQKLEQTKTLRKFEAGEYEQLQKDIETATGAAMQAALYQTRPALDRLLTDWKNTTRQLQEASADWMTDLRDRLTDSVMAGKLKFQDFANAIIRDLVRIKIQQGLVGIFGGGTGSAGVAGLGKILGFQSGGSFAAGQPFIAGEGGRPELIIPSTAGTVVPMGGGGMVVNIHNQGAPVTGEARPPRFDGERWVLDVVLRNLDSRGPLYRAIAGM